ncbi:hypothetical protein APSETT444_006862 [Aspergillus pseudonomiae]
MSMSLPEAVRVFGKVKSLFEEAKEDQIDPDKYKELLLTGEYKDRLARVVKEFDKKKDAPALTSVKILGPCSDAPTVLRMIKLSQEARLKALKPLTDVHDINFLTRKLFPEEIIFTSKEYKGKYSFTMSCNELLKRANDPSKFRLPEGRGVIYLGKLIALIPKQWDSKDKKMLIWSCEFVPNPETKDAYAKNILTPKISPDNIRWERTYLDTTRDEEIQNTLALVFLGEMPVIRTPDPPVIY